MRQIKFRAWDSINNEMVYPKGFDLTIGGLVDRYENLMQFTGLLDKNGKEIYEGDIVKGFYYLPLPNPENEPKVAFEIFGKVEWSDGYYSFGGMFHPDMELEVIGNIYENPYLLK